MAERTHCLAPGRHPRLIDAPTTPTAYRRMFPDLPSFSADEKFLYALGGSGGLCDCGDATDDESSLGEGAAGWPIFGQFIAHDVTADRSAPSEHADVSRLTNARSPRLDLDALYGDGPAGQPFLYTRADPARLLVTGDGRDVPRNSEGIAIIGDPRNDSHMLMSQMHLAFTHAHNAFVDRVRRRGVPEAEVFTEAARDLRWHYQSAVLNEYLPNLVGQELVDEIIDEGPRYYRPDGEPFIPLEFADGAFRYGHGQIRQRYSLQSAAQPVQLFPDLLGFRPVPPLHVVDWSLMFDRSGRPAAQRARKMDGRLVGALIKLPIAVTGECEIDAYHSLATRDLQRGQGVGLPSGEAVARKLGEAPLSPDEIGLGRMSWRDETPLWYYVLREADVHGGGHRLGPVGGRIICETLVGLLDADPTSARHAPEEWQPELSLIDLLTVSKI